MCAVVVIERCWANRGVLIAVEDGSEAHPLGDRDRSSGELQSEGVDVYDSLRRRELLQKFLDRLADEGI